MIKIKVFQFYFYPDISAVSQLLGELLRQTAESREFDITVYCGKTAYTGGRNSEKLPDSLGNVKIKRFPTPTIGKKNLLMRLLEYSVFYFAVFFTALFSSGKSVILSLTSPPMVALFAAAAVRLRKNRFIYYIEDLFPETLYDMGYVKDPVKIRKLKKLNRFIFKRADQIITLGSKMTARITDGYGVVSDKVYEIPNWYTEKGFTYSEPVLKNEFKMFYSGNMGIAHDFSLLEKLVLKLKNDPDILYEFSGGGNRKGEIESIFLKTDEVRVNITGYRDNNEHFKALQDADILVVAQKKETVGDILPSKIYSYLAAGRPILFLGPVDSEIAEIIICNDIGFVLELADDVESAVEYIRYLKANPEIKNKIGKRARYLYEKQYTLSESVKKFDNLLKNYR